MKESRDILTLFEQLNSHEVFTPPRVARDMLALLPKEIWGDPSIRILDPCVKSGVFLREALYLLIDGLAGKGKHVGHDGIEYDLNDGQQRMNHILKNMLFGIATSELTGYISRRTLYGVMEANTDKQTALIDAFEKSKSHKKWTEEEKVRFLVRNHFNEYYDHRLFNTPDYAGFEDEGNIFYPTEEVNKQVDDSGAFIIEDTYYPFIEEQVNHGKIKQIKDGQMKFDVVIGNPPYQVRDGGGISSAMPIYHHFIDSAVKVKAKYISMVTPSGWLLGGKGQDEFRERMLSSGSFVNMTHFDNAKELFPGVEIMGGVNYFLYDKSYKGPCLFNGVMRDMSLSKRFVTDNKAASIIEKVISTEGFSSFERRVSGRNPFGLSTKERGVEQGDVTLYHSQGTGLMPFEHVAKSSDLIGREKVFLSGSNGGALRSGKIISVPFVVKKNTCCTDTYLVIEHGNGVAEFVVSYLKTKFVRFLIKCLKNTQLNPRRVFQFVPDFEFSKKITDTELYEMFNLTDSEIKHIENEVSEME